jgi:mannan endo-1,4-beta-mannosidase
MIKIIISSFLINSLIIVVIAQDNYSINDSIILKNSVSWEFNGTDNMAVFGLPYDYSSQVNLGMDIVRECIDLKITSDANLQTLVSNARSKNLVIILAGMWYDNDAFSGGTTPYPDCQLLGANPQQDSRWGSVMTRWQQIANLPFIKNHSDVWLNLWNEPYYWDGTHGYTDDMWEVDGKAMVDSIRNIGASNIIVIEGSHTGQGYQVIIDRGKNVRQGRTNVLFDIHAYNSKWNISKTSIQLRFQQIRNSGNAFIVGEFANNGDEVWQPVMDACRAEKVSLLSWLWGQYKEPFGTTFEQYCMASRNTETIINPISKEDLEVYPNPASNYIELQSTLNNAIINLFAINGKQIIKTRLNDNKIDISGLQKGVYILKVTKDEKILVTKIIKE